MDKTVIAQGTGRRKTAVARVYARKGKGQIVINGKPGSDYFTRTDYRNLIQLPLKMTDNLKSYDFYIRVTGGGMTGQAGACSHGITRALLVIDENNRPALKANGLITRDSRMVERKKYGQRGARRRFQFSKR